MQRLTHIQNECADNDLLKLKGDFYSMMNESCLFIFGKVNALVNCVSFSKKEKEIIKVNY